MKRNAKKYIEDGITFDSRVEYNFYHRFIRGKGYRFRHHERFYLTDKYALGGVMGRAVTYTPRLRYTGRQGRNSTCLRCQRLTYFIQY